MNSHALTVIGHGVYNSACFGIGTKVDSAFSLEPDEFATLVQESEVAWTARGRVHFGVSAAEAGSLRFRRSLYCVRDIAAGEAFTLENVRAIRPGFGLPPSELDTVLGKPSTVAIDRGTPLAWLHVSR